MPTLTIRNVSERAHDALRRRAAENRRSMEAEVRALVEALDVPPATEDQLQALRDLQAHTLAAVGGQDGAKGALEAFLADRRKDWGED